jgi:hypothetical protein
MNEKNVKEAAEVIWNTSRADEGTISATGAEIIARALEEKRLLAFPGQLRPEWNVMGSDLLGDWEMAEEPMTKEEAELMVASMEKSRNPRAVVRFTTDWMDPNDL